MKVFLGILFVFLENLLKVATKLPKDLKHPGGWSGERKR